MIPKTLLGVLCSLPLIGCDSKIPEINTTNPEIEQIVQKELEDAVAAYQATAATGIVMKSKTGEVLSMVSVGNVDPMKNTYEMGSHFKVFNTVLAYENELGDKEYRIDEPLMIYDKFGKPAIRKPIDDIPVFKNDIKKRGITRMNVSDILLNGSNVGCARIALDLPNGAYAEMFRRLRLKKPLKLDLGKTGKTSLPSKKGVVETATTSFGHGVSVTPMHMIASLNAVVTGEYVLPRFNDATKIQKEQVVSEDISKHIRDILQKKSTKNNQNCGFSSATVEKKHINNQRNSLITSAFAAFPVETPEYSVFILLDDPKRLENFGGLKTAAWNVIPTTDKILKQIQPILSK